MQDAHQLAHGPDIDFNHDGATVEVSPQAFSLRPGDPLSPKLVALLAEVSMLL